MTSEELERVVAALREERDALRLALRQIYRVTYDRLIERIVCEALEKDYGHAPPQA